MNFPTAFLFPGQGKLPQQLPPHASTVHDLYRFVEERGLTIRDWVCEGAVDRLTRTEIGQPALLIDSLARENALRTRDWSPQIAAGHSLGEYAALVSAGALAPLDALMVVVERGRLMGKVSGGMTAILKLDIEKVQELCDAVGGGVTIANHNAPRQIVVSGEAEALQRLVARAEEAGGRAIPLRVSGPFHSPKMRSAQEALASILRDVSFSPPRIPVASGVSGEIERDVQRLRELLCVQMTSPVRWVDVIRQLESAGIERAVEVGEGEVLVNLGKRITPGIRFMTFEEAVDEGV